MCRYHLKEWSAVGRRPQNKEELFNLRHSKLRNVIERSFGVVKKRFGLLAEMGRHQYPFEIQVKLVQCMFMVHNFIRVHALYEDAIFRTFNEDYVPDVDRDTPRMSFRNPDARTVPPRVLTAWRDGIASSMWDAYKQEMESRRRFGA